MYLYLLQIPARLFLLQIINQRIVIVVNYISIADLQDFPTSPSNHSFIASSQNPN